MQSLRKMLTDRPWERLGQFRQERGVLLFGLIWFGQLVSLVGSGVTEFGLGVWVFQRTGAATDYALIALCISLPHVLVGPVAGPLVDAFSVNLWIVVGGVASVLLGIAGLLLPVVMNVEEQMAGQQAAEVPVSVR